jgi:hypothetical protein
MDVLLVDDHPILHETLRAVVASIDPQAEVHWYIYFGCCVSI